MATSGGNSSTRLVEEISDQFLICQICYDVYRQPKTLSCLHTFCVGCLEKHQEAELERSYRYLLYSRAITCPICRKKTEMPAGGIRRLPDNFLLANLADVINRRKSRDRVQRCEICKPAASGGADCRTNVAVSKCLDCSKLLCRSCLELHRRTKVTQSHSLFDIDVEKDIQCKVHEDEVVRFYCEPCEVCVCVVCTFQEHKGHEVASFTEAVDKYRHSLDNLLANCRLRIEQLAAQLALINSCEADIKAAEEQITEVAIESISAIRKKERELIRDLYLTYGEQAIEFIKEKDNIRDSVNNLQSTCNLTDVILQERSVELLLLKKDIQQKLTLLLQRKWISPPDIVHKHVRFVPRKPELGYLQIGDEEHVPDGGEEERSRVTSSPPMSVVTRQRTTVMCQTHVIYTSDAITSMGKPVQNFCDEQVTQTDAVIRKEAGTLTVPGQGKPEMMTKCTLAVPEVRDRQTMTASTPTMKRKIQTERVGLTDRQTNTAKHDADTQSVFVNTQTTDTADRSTMTKIRKLVDRTTCTAELIQTRDNEVGTEPVSLRSWGTLTSLPDTQNKSTLTVRPASCDKKIATARRICVTQETNTNHVTTLDMGIMARVYGRDVSVTTRTTVTENTAIGDGHVGTTDVCVSTQDTPDHVTSGNYISATNNTTLSDQVTATTKATETETKTYDDKSVCASNMDDEQKVKVATLDSICQTMISIIDAVLWPSLMPVDVGTSTDALDELSLTTPTSHDSKSTNTDVHTTADAAVGDASCLTSDVGSDVSAPSVEIGVGTARQPTQDQASGPDRKCAIDVGSCTESTKTTDSWHDAFKGYLVDADTNTELDIKVPPVLLDSSTNTCSPPVSDNKTDTAVSVKDCQTEMTPRVFVTCSTNTDQPDVTNSVTSMGAGVRTCDRYVSTVKVDLTNTAYGESNVYVTDRMTYTDPASVTCQATETDRLHMITRETETLRARTSDVGVFTSVDVSNAATDAIQPEVSHRETFMEPVLQSTIGVGTVSSQTYSKAVGTDPPQRRDVTSYTYVQSLDKATYMPRSITVTTGTSTQHVFTSDKMAATERVELFDSGTNTTVAKVTDGETTMSSVVRTSDIKVNTDHAQMVDSQNDPIRVQCDNRSTNTPRPEYSDAEAGTPEIFTLSAGTSTQHRMSYTDRDTVTDTLDVRDQTTATVRIETRDQQSDIRPLSRSIGILKRPHTVSRGAGTRHVQYCTTSTSPHQPYIADRGTMTSVRTENKSTSGLPYEIADRCTGTPYVEHVEHATETALVLTEQRGCSPVRQALTDRCSSPLTMFPCRERETSPILWPVSEKYTSTIQIELRTQSTEMPPVHLTERGTSPAAGPPDPDTVHRGTSMPRLIQQDASCSAEPDVAVVGVNTSVRPLVDRASTPVRLPVRHQETSAVVSTEDKESYTVGVATSDKYTSVRQPRTANSSTSMPQVTYLEKETCTPRVHIMHKNTCTENMQMVDKQTNTVVDITAAYRQNVTLSKPPTVNRGTSMSEAVCDVRAAPAVVERGSSPIRAVMVDKGVSAKKGEILEPVDTYQSPGGAAGSKKHRKARPRPRLASIEEDSSESSIESLEEEPMKTMSPLLFPSLAPVNPRVLRPKLPVAGITHKERLWPATPRMGKFAVSAFNSEGRSAPSVIVCKVDVATNTRDVVTETRATWTDRAGQTSDKGVSTEFLPVESKMAECISKLRTVRNRLEQRQPSVGSEWTLQAGHRPLKCPTLGVTMRSKSLGDNLNEHDLGQFTAPATLSTSGSSDGGGSSSSHGDGDDKLSASAASRQKARKKRLDINQLLRSSSLPESDSPPRAPAALQPPTALTKPRIRTVYAQVIPKLNVDDFKLKATTRRPSPSASSRKSSPKRRARTPSGESKKQTDVPQTPQDTPPEPPKRSSSLRHALLAGKSADVSSASKKDDPPKDTS